MARLAKSTKYELIDNIISDTFKKRIERNEAKSDSFFATAVDLLVGDDLDKFKAPPSLVGKYFHKSNYLTVELSGDLNLTKPWKKKLEVLRKARRSSVRIRADGGEQWVTYKLTQKRVQSTDKKASFLPAAQATNQFSLSDIKHRPLAHALINYWTEVKDIYLDRQALIIQLVSVIDGMTTVAQLKAYDESFLKFLPKPEPAVKPLVISQEKLKATIKCCAKGVSDCFSIKK